MGSVGSKCKWCCYTAKCHEKAKKGRARVRALEEEVDELRRARESEVRARERSASAFALKEEEWRREKTRHREEVAGLRRMLQEEEDRRRRLEEEVAAAAAAAANGSGDQDKNVKEWQQRRVGRDYLLEQMKEEQARREEAVEKWKQLYLAIKTELDDLIQRTWQGERLFWGTEEAMVEKLQKESKAKDETVEALRTRIAVMEKEGARRDREIDILRQSLRILSNKKKTRLRQKRA